jgi:hypothetical protein
METTSRFRMAPPAWLVLFLAPAIGELLSSSAPPAEFFSPFGFPSLVLLYGTGALLCRELAFRWRKGWAGLLLLGAAYGVLEEGIAVMSFFNPAWVDLGPMAGHGRWLGVNWVWTLNLTVYHAVISVAIPVLIAGLCFPQWRDRPWTGPRTRFVLWILLALDTVLIALLLGKMLGYTAPMSAFLASGAVMVLLGGLARRMPEGSLSPGTDAAKASPLLFGIFGFMGMAVFYLQMFLLPEAGVSAAMTLLIAAALSLAGAWILRRMTRKGRVWNERQQAALVAGGLLVMALFALIAASENANRPDNTAGMGIVGLIALLLLTLLLRAVWKRRADIAEMPESI